MARSAGKKYDDPLFEEADSLVSGKLIRKCADSKGSHDSGIQSCAPEDLRDIQAVHDRGQHADLIGFDTGNLIAGAAAPDIASAGHDTDLMSGIVQLPDLGSDPRDHLLVVQLHSALCVAHGAVVFTGQCLS